MRQDGQRQDGQTVGERVRWLREQRGWTPAQLTRLAQQAQTARGLRAGQFDRTTLHRVEHDERTPATATVLALADALDTTTNFLLGRTADPAPAPVTPRPFPAPDVVPLVECLNALAPATRRPITAALVALLRALLGAGQLVAQGQQDEGHDRRPAEGQPPDSRRL